MAEGWQLETQRVAIRGSRLGLTRETYRDTTVVERPITLEYLALLEVGDDGIGRSLVMFDPDDLNGAIAELTARWIASGEVEHPEVIEAQRWLAEALNRQDWGAYADACASAIYVNHRQLASGETISEHVASIRTMASLVPDLRFETAEILAHSALGFVAHSIVRGLSVDGLPIELPLIGLTLIEGDRVTRMEIFDADQRELALDQFEQLNRSG
jgi:hypothetical protein